MVIMSNQIVRLQATPHFIMLHCGFF